MTTAASLIAALLYLAAAGWQGKRLFHDHLAEPGKGLLPLVALALVIHGLVLPYTLWNEQGLQLAITRTPSLILWSITAIILVSSLRRPVHNLFALLLPFSALSIFLSFTPQEPVQLSMNMGIGILSHILLSIIAYSLLTIATLQALLLSLQNKQLRERHTGGITKVLPPLQTMESLLFEMLWSGFLLLTAGIAVGFVFIEDMFAQHLAHKTMFTLLSWLIYAVLLGGRHLQGWRGRIAINWTLGGFSALLLAYFGSKLVLEVIL